MRRPDYIVFEGRYAPILDEEGHIKQYENIPENVSTDRIWTCIEAGDKWYLSAGHHVVNRLFYVVATLPHKFEPRDYLFY